MHTIEIPTEEQVVDYLITVIEDAYKDAINSGKFEYLKRDISNARVKREKEIIDAVKNYRIIFTDEEYDAYPEHVKEFIEAYSNSPDVDVKLLPAKYLKEYFDGVATQLSPEIITSWTKVLKREALTPEDSKNIEKIRNIETIKIDESLIFPITHSFSSLSIVINFILN